MLVDLAADPSSDSLGRVLQAEGKFTVDLLLSDSLSAADIGDRLQTFLAGESGGEASRSESHALCNSIVILAGETLPS